MRRTSKAGECDAAQKLSRRGFVAGSALGAAALGLAGASGMTSTTGWLAPALANEETKERTATIFHMNHCEGKCTLKCTVRDGRLCMIEPQEWPNRMERTICVKALADIERIYGEGRVQVPMRRIGQRGDGAYVAISWDEALAEIQEKLGAVIKTYGPESVLLCGGSEQLTTNSLAVAMGFQGITAYAIDGNYPNGVGPATGQGFIEGDGRDLVNTRTLLNLGNNAYETALISAHVLNDARDAGCYFITVDPFLSTTAGKSDQWVPINPGCDHAFLLALIHVVVENDWTDKTFMKEHTAFPYLIESETKRIMRAEVTQADIDAAAEAAAEVAAVDEFDPASVLGKPLVWDNSLQAAVSYSEAADPALEGRFEVNGAICEPVYTHLLRQIEDYTPEWAADVTGISADTIKEIADRFANKGPSFIQCSYGGADKYSTGDIAGHAAVVLAGVTGNFGKPGSGGIKPQVLCLAFKHRWEVGRCPSSLLPKAIWWMTTCSPASPMRKTLRRVSSISVTS